MQKYVKPTISMTASITPDQLGTCMVQADLELIQSIVGNGIDMKDTFGMQEACAIQIPLDMYCKFTSAELGAAQAFNS